MKSKFVIFLAFASLVLSSSTSKRSKEESAIISQIKDSQRASIVAYSEGFKPVFDRLDVLAANLTLNLIAQTHEDPAKIISDGLIRAKNAVDLYFDSILSVVQRKSCCDVQSARNASHHDLENAFARIIIALKLAERGNDHQNRSAIELHMTAVQQDFFLLANRAYDSICTCFDTCKDAYTRATMKKSQDGSRLGLFHLANAVFNAIKRYAVAVAVGCKDVTLIFNMEEYRRKALVGIKDNAGNGSSAIATFYMNSQANRPEIVSRLAAIQTARSVATNRYNEAMEAAFGTIIGYLEIMLYGYGDNGKEDFSRIDNDRSTVISKFNIGNVAHYTSLSTLYPNATSTILEEQAKLIIAEDVGIGAFYEAIYAAAARGNNSTETMQKINNIRNVALSLADDYADSFFNVIFNNQRFDAGTEAVVKAYNEEAIRVDTITISTFFDAVDILAKATQAGRVSEADIPAAQALLVTSNDGLDGFCNALADACTTALQAPNSG